MAEKNNNSDLNTSGNSISIRNYFRDIRKLETLSGSEQIELAIKAKNGDRKSMNRLIESNLRFVLSVAKDYTWSGIPLEELANEGNIGLAKAVTKFDETKGVKFISFAVWWIRQSIMQSIYDNGSAVRIPLNKINNIGKIGKATEMLRQNLDREPTVQELIEITELSEKDVSFSVNEARTYVSVDDKIKPGSEGEIGDFIVGETMEDIDRKTNIESLREELNRAVEDFSEREKTILNMFFGTNGYPEMSLKEIGEELNLTNERVRQLKEFALKKLRMYKKSSNLKEFLNCSL